MHHLLVLSGNACVSLRTLAGTTISIITAVKYVMGAVSPTRTKQSVKIMYNHQLNSYNYLLLLLWYWIGKRPKGASWIY
ncbi:hypothetical protein J3F83DRAFT_743049 [Trichoderma novae-zelandiae]